MSLSHFRMPGPAETGKWEAPRLGWEATLHQHEWGTLDIRTKQLQEEAALRRRESK